MTDPHPAERVYITVNEQRWELVPTSKLLGPEVQEMKRVSKGMALVPLERGLAEMDYDAWFAWLYVSIRRKRPTLTEAELTAAIADTPLVALVETIEKEAPEVAAPDPPEQSSPNGLHEPENDNGSGETTLQPSISETFGQPT